MALTDCFVNTGSLQGFMTCLRESENLTGVAVVAVLLAAWLVIQLTAQRRKKAQQHVALPGIPVTQHTVRFVCEQNIDAVYNFANRELFQLLLTEMEKALADSGYILTRNASSRCELTESELSEIGGRIYRVREQYMVPFLSDEVLNGNTRLAVRLGCATAWLNMLIRANEAQGWYIRRHLSMGGESWQDVAWPVKQVIVKVSASAPVLTRDLVRTLKEASFMLEQMAFQEWESVVRKPVPVTTQGIQAELIRQTCRTPPGFFPAPAGHDVPAGLQQLAEEHTPHGVQRTVTVFVQVTKRKNTSHVVAWLKEASERFETGEACGGEYDDDNGYAFIVSPPAGSD